MMMTTSKAEPGRLSRPTGSVSPHQLKNGAGKPFHIALVDDDQQMRVSIQCLLRKAAAGWTITSFPSGEEALSQIPGTPIDVVLMDIDMNGISGLDCARRLKEIKPGLPIIMLSAFYRSGEVLHAKTVGADGFLVKPIEDGEQLVQTIKSVLCNLRVFCPETESELIRQSVAQTSAGNISPFVENFSAERLAERYGVRGKFSRDHFEANGDFGTGLGVHRPRRWLISLVHDDPGAVQFVNGALRDSMVGCVTVNYPGAREALRGFKGEKPTVVLVQFREHSIVLANISHLRAHLPHVPIIVLSPHREREAIFSCLAARASGYLILPVAAKELVRALLSGVAGLSAFCKEAEKLVGEYMAHALGSPAASIARENLSECETAVWACLERGYSDKETAEVLRVAVRTISSFKARLYEKLGVHCREEAIAKVGQGQTGGPK